MGVVRRVIRNILRLVLDDCAEGHDSDAASPKSTGRTSINLKLAYEAAVIEAKQQEATLDDLRSRAINFMSAISIAVSIFIAINRHGPFFRWWLSAAGLLYVIGCFMFVTILLPQLRWRFCQDPTWLLEIHDDSVCLLDEDRFFMFAAKETIKDNEKNATNLEQLQNRFKWGILSFLFSIVILIGLFIFR
jgi:hypothetical protein